MSDAFRSILFTGHMMDLPDRKEPRFPAALEPAVTNEITARLKAALAKAAPDVIGLASGARGGDIIFHECSRALGAPTCIVLPFPPETFIEKSVSGLESGNWIGRFRALWNATPQERREVMNLPQSDDAYGRCNSRLVELARARGPFHLIALWNGKGGDGPGGTQDMVEKARAQADAPDIIAPQDLQAGEG